MSTQAVAVIGGTGLYGLDAAEAMERIATPYGDAIIYRLRQFAREVIFLARHGVDHALPPHRINYRANIWALHALGVRRVVATHAVGSMNPSMAPGHFAVLAQFIDWTKSRPLTFFDGQGGPVVHADVTYPYCAQLSGQLLYAATSLGDRIHRDAVYACMEGPRFETAAEIHALRLLGADVVGMTSVPEVVLAREAGLCYSAICIICNWAAGMSASPLTHEEVLVVMQEHNAELRSIIKQVLVQGERGCSCEQVGFGKMLPTPLEKDSMQ